MAMKRLFLIGAAVAALPSLAQVARGQPETRDPARGVHIKMWDLCLSGQLYQQLKDQRGDADEIFAACREEEMAVLPEGTPEAERQRVRRAWLSGQLEQLRDQR